jgi:hypothetical protein
MGQAIAHAPPQNREELLRRGLIQASEMRGAIERRRSPLPSNPPDNLSQSSGSQNLALGIERMKLSSTSSQTVPSSVRGGSRRGGSISWRNPQRKRSDPYNPDNRRPTQGLPSSSDSHTSDHYGVPTSAIPGPSSTSNPSTVKKLPHTRKSVEDLVKAMPNKWDLNTLKEHNSEREASGKDAFKQATANNLYRRATKEGWWPRT